VNNNEVRFKDDDEKKETPPYIVAEGWLRISLKTPGIDARYPSILNEAVDFPKRHNFTYVDLKDEKQKAAIDTKTFFDPHRHNSQFGLDADVVTPDAFYFRLTENGHLYYTETKTDTIVLQGMDPKDMDATPNKKNDCFMVNASANEWWVLCSVDSSCPEAWKTALAKQLKLDFSGCPAEVLPEEAAPEEADEAKEVTIQEREVIEIQPMFIQPQPALDCKYDFDFKYHGINWKCRCPEGLEQSPINLPVVEALEYYKKTVKFQYDYVGPENLEAVFDRGVVRIRTINGKSFGTLVMEDPIQAVFSADEIVIRTPAEHFVSGKKYDMEVQVMHTAVSGDVKFQANLSFLYQISEGEVGRAFSKLDIMNLPNPKINVVKQALKDKLHVFDFFFDEKDDVENGAPFNYFVYIGSQTMPPCAENVFWIIPDDTQTISSTIVGMFMDALIDPESDVPNPITSGNNRVIMKLNKRWIRYYDFSLGVIAPRREGKFESPNLKSHYERLEV